MGEKLRAVFLPTLLLTAGMAAVLSLLNYALVLRTPWLPLDEDVAAIWLPLAAAIAGVGFVIVPRLHILALNEKRNIPALYTMVALLIVAGPAILAQKYLQASVGEIVQVPDAAAIPPSPAARYYTIATPCLRKSGALPHTRITISGDHDEDLNVYLYAAVPFCDGPVWLGLTWGDQIDNRLGDAQKDALYRAFLNQSQDALSRLDPHDIRFFERVGRNDLRRGLLKALAKNHIADAAPVFVTPHAEPFAPQGGQWLGGTALALLGGALLWLFMLALAPVKPLEERKPSAPGGASAVFVPRKEYFGLPVLLDINLLVYFAMVLSGLGFLDFELDDLIAWGASSGNLDHGFGAIRLITATFVHAGLFHILGNMYGLIVGALFLSPVARNTRLLFIYLVSGLGGSLLSVSVHPDYVMVGASGAIFGMFGALIALIALRDAKMVPLTRVILINVGVYLVLNIVYGATTPGVDNFAHIGGFLTGLLCGAVIYILDRREARAVA